MGNFQIQTVRKKKLGLLNTFIYWSWALLITGLILQCVVFSSIENWLACSAILFVWALFVKINLKKDLLTKYPLSVFLMFGFTVTQFYFPPLFTLLEGKPVTYNLELPVQVFFHSTLVFIILVISHFFYRTYMNKRADRSSESLLFRNGFFSPPSNLQLWLMGFIGIIAMAYIYIYSKIGGQAADGATDKFIQGFVPFSYAPFLIPLRRLFGKIETENKNIFLKLLIFTVVLFLVSIARNSRGAFMFGFTGIAFSFFLSILLGIYRPKLLTLRNVLILFLIVWTITGPMADLATAMVIVRGQRKDISSIELVEKTFKAFNDKKAISAYRLATNKVTGSGDSDDWNESYLNNVFLARFCNLKFNDLSLVQAAKIGKQDAQMLKFTESRLLATLPGPLLNLIGLQSNKLEVNGGSFGDYLYYRAGAGASVLGGYRTASMSGTGMASFGWWYLLVLFVGLIPVYFLIDKFVLIKQDGRKQAGGVSRFELRFSVCGLLIITSIFQFLPSETVTSTFVFVLRGWLQAIFLYYLIFHFTKKIEQLSLRRSRKLNSLRPKTYYPKLNS